jgi:hypothetical protein
MKKVFILAVTLISLASCDSKVKLTPAQERLVQKQVDSLVETSLQESVERRYTPIEDSLPIKILAKKLTEHNSVGGVGVDIDFKNISGKTIKYIYFEVLPYNRVGDLEFGRHSQYPTPTRLKLTGPIKNNKKDNYWNDVLWYSWDISKFEIVSVEIEYMDGTTYKNFK